MSRIWDLERGWGNIIACVRKHRVSLIIRQYNQINEIGTFSFADNGLGNSGNEIDVRSCKSSPPNILSMYSFKGMEIEPF